jgi:hypothetical protein
MSRGCAPTATFPAQWRDEGNTEVRSVLVIHARIAHVTDKYDEYRQYAKEAEQRADIALRDEDRANWLRIAHKWLRLLPARESGPDDHAGATSKSRTH